MNANEIKTLCINDNHAATIKRLSTTLAHAAKLLPKGIIAPERAKDGGFVIIHRTRVLRHTAFTVAAAAGADEKALKAIGGLHAEGKAALICRALADNSAGRLFCPRSVRAAADAYERDIIRGAYAAWLHNWSVRTDSVYALRVAAEKAEKAAAAEARAAESRVKAETALKKAESVRAAAATDVQLAAARAAAERGAEIAALQEEVDAEIA